MLWVLITLAFFMTPGLLLPRAFALFLFSISHSLLFSQSATFDCYYINVSGDTVRGSFPKYREWNYNPDRFSFLPSGSQNEIELSPANCKKLEVFQHDRYIAYRGPRLTNPISISNTSGSEGRDLYDTLSTFLRQLPYVGANQFFVFEDRVRLNLFYAGTDGQIIELRQKVFVQDNRIIRSDEYKAQLESLFPGDKVAVSSVLYSEAGLTRFLRPKSAETFLEGKSVSLISVRHKKYNFIISAGISSNSLKFTSQQGLYFTNLTYKVNIKPVFSLSYLVPLPRNLSRFFLLPQLRVSSFDHTASNNFNNGQFVFESRFKSSPVIAFGINPGVNLINGKNLQFALMPGYHFAVLIKNTQTDETRVAVNGVINRVETDMASTSSFANLQSQFVFLDRFVLWGSYNFPMSITNYDAKYSRLSSVQIAAGVKF